MNLNRLRWISPLLLVFGCSATDTSELNKAEVADAFGKDDSSLLEKLCTDHGQPPDCDPCEVMGWYGDDECDSFCPDTDPACVDCEAFSQSFSGCLDEHLSYGVCTDPARVSDGELQLPPVEGSAEAEGIIAMLNAPETTLEILDDDAALDSRAATNLIAHRDGPDGIPATDDDDLFDDLAEVDAVAYVGPAALEQLAEFADAQGYITRSDLDLDAANACCDRWAEAEGEDLCPLVDPTVGVQTTAIELPETLAPFEDAAVTFGVMYVQLSGERYSQALLNSTFARGRDLFGERCDGVLFDGALDFNQNHSIETLFNFYRGGALDDWDVALRPAEVDALEAYIDEQGRDDFVAFYARDEVSEADCFEGEVNASLIWNSATNTVIYMVMYPHRADAQPPSEEAPSIEVLGSTSARITFSTTTAQEATVEYGLVWEEETTTVVSTASTDHELLLEELTPKGSYQVTITTGTESDGPSFFHLPSEQERFRVLFDQAHAQTAGNANWTVDESGPTPEPADPDGHDAWNGGYSSFAYDLYSTGRFDISTLTEGQALTFGDGSDTDMASFDVVVVAEPNVDFTRDERNALIRYVREGGALLIIGNHANSDRNNDGMDSRQIWNALAADNDVVNDPFSITFEASGHYAESVTSFDPDTEVDAFSGPFGDVDAFTYYEGATITVNSDGGAQAMAPLAWRQGWEQALLITAGISGRGRFVAIGDSAIANDGTNEINQYVEYKDAWTDLDNAPLVLNLTAWLAGYPGEQ